MGPPRKFFNSKIFKIDFATIYCALVLLDSFFNKDPCSTQVNSLSWTRLDSRKFIPINNAPRELSGASMATPTSMATFEKDCCVRRCHLYRRVWDFIIGEHLICRREPTNLRGIETCETPRTLDIGSTAVARAVVKDNNIIKHLPKKASQVCSLF